MTNNFGPLSGLKVLDIGTTIAGPMTATFLAEFGAEVIKIEHPEKGDDLRSWPPMKNDTSLWWKMTARNKKLITLNLKKEEGQSIFKEMIKDTDVVIENFRPGTLEKWNLGYDVLSKINPGLVLLRISGYGQDGPYSKKPGYGTIAEGISGIPSFTGFPDSPPTLSSFPLADVVTSLFGTSSIMYAIYNKEHKGNGLGEVIDLSLYEAMFRLVDPLVIGYDQLGVVKTRNGNRMEEAAPRNTYQTIDDYWVTISASSDATFKRLSIAIEKPELIYDERFVKNPERVKNVEQLDTIIENWISKRKLDDIMDVFDYHGVVAGPINDIKMIFENEHFKFRENIITVMDNTIGKAKVQNVVPKFSRAPGKVSHLGLEKGANNKDVFCTDLGISEEKYKYLIKNKII